LSPQILSGYDITVVQEVRDTDLSAVRKLMDQLNSVSPHPYSFLDSIPLGRTSYKEQYLFIYRSDMVSVLGSYYYDDGCESCGTDTFSREPFIVKFSSPTTQVEQFVMVPLHSEPSSAADEIDALYDVYTDVVNKLPPRQGLTAACPAEVEQFVMVPLHSEPSSAADEIDALYDVYTDVVNNIVACGTALRKDIEPGSATVNNFQKTFHLQSKDALAVSDHFPVEVTLKAR
ncbi:Deoxyribonuclease-1, partial [Tyto alba]